jgi:hypothetical protein
MGQHGLTKPPGAKSQNQGQPKPRGNRKKKKKKKGEEKRDRWHNNLSLMSLFLPVFPVLGTAPRQSNHFLQLSALLALCFLAPKCPKMASTI